MARIMVWSSLRIMRLHTNYRFMKIDISECKAANIPLITSAGLAMDLKVIVRSGEHSRKIKGAYDPIAAAVVAAMTFKVKPSRLIAPLEAL